jgi:hypothetical protein
MQPECNPASNRVEALVALAVQPPDTYAGDLDTMASFVTPDVSVTCSGVFAGSRPDGSRVILRRGGGCEAGGCDTGAAPQPLFTAAECDGLMEEEREA